MNAEQNQVHSMEDFVRRHCYVSLLSGNPLRLEASMRTGLTEGQEREDFFILHDGFERANSLYQNFQRAYSSIEGALEPEQVRSLYAVLEEMREAGIGDVGGMFRPLEAAEDDVHRRFSRPLQASAVPYFMFPEEVREAHRNRLLPFFSQLPRHGREQHYEVSVIPEEYLWNLHVQPRDFLQRLSAVVDLENMARYVNNNITPYEYAEAWNLERRYAEHIVESRFAEGAAEYLHQRHPNLAITVAVPSLQNFRKSLPSELRPTEMFNLHALGDLRRNLQDLSTTTLFESYRTEALNNGWLRELGE